MGIESADCTTARLGTMRKRNRIAARLGLAILSLLLTLSIGDSSAANAQEASNRDWQAFNDLSARYAKYQQQGKWDEQAGAAAQIVELFQRRFPPRWQYLATSLLADGRASQARFGEALALHKEVIRLLERYSPRGATERRQAALSRGNAMRGIGFALAKLERIDDAIPYFIKAIDWFRQIEFPQLAAHAEADLGKLYRNRGELDQAKEHLSNAVDAFRRETTREDPPGPMHRFYAHALAALASVDTQAGRYHLAEPRLLEAVAVIKKARFWNHQFAAQITIDVGNVYASQGRYDEALAFYELARRVFEGTVGSENWETTKATAAIARMHQNLGRFDDAEKLFREVLNSRIQQFGRGHNEVASTLGDLGQLLAMMGQYEEAESLLSESIAINKKVWGPVHRATAATRMQMARLELLRERFDDARVQTEAVIRIHRQSPLSATEMMQAHLFAASADWHSGHSDAAIEHLEESLVQAETARGYSAGAERERAFMFADLMEPYELMVDWRAKQGDLGTLFYSVERRKARSFLDELRLAEMDLFADRSEDEQKALKARESELRREVLLAEKAFEEIVLADSEGAPADDGVRQQVANRLLGSRDALYQHLTNVRATSRIYRELIVGTMPGENALAPLTEVQKRLDDDELVLAYAFTINEGFVISVRGDVARFERLRVEDETATVLGVQPGPLNAAKMSQILVSGDAPVMAALSSSTSAAPNDGHKLSRQLAALWRSLVPESEKAALTSGEVKLVTIIPDGALALVPFEALVVSEGDSDDPVFLLDAGPPLAYAPSAAVWLNLAAREVAPPGRREPVLTLGDPAYPQSSGAALSRLPFSDWEAKWIEEHFTDHDIATVRLTGTAATESAVRHLSEGRKILHLACHGAAEQSYGNLFGTLAVAPGRPGDPADDGYLSMSEIYELDLNGCELAILSACETNYGPQQRGEGVWALSRGFLVAGARRVVASNWVVDDKAGATLVSYFADYLSREGGDLSERDFARALHRAKKQVRKQQQWANPFYWSSLVMVGPN